MIKGTGWVRVILPGSVCLDYAQWNDRCERCHLVSKKKIRDVRVSHSSCASVYSRSINPVINRRDAGSAYHPVSCEPTSLLTLIVSAWVIYVDSGSSVFLHMTFRATMLVCAHERRRHIDTETHTLCIPLSQSRKHQFPTTPPQMATLPRWIGFKRNLGYCQM